MGRAKQKMELISNPKARYVTFQKRKKGLKKKTYELKTLCDVDVCLVVYDPKIDDDNHDNDDDEPEIWPPNPDEIQRLINSYKNQSTEDRVRRTLNLSNFFHDRNQKIEDALAKLRKKNDEARYATWDERYDNSSEEKLREFESMLERKIQYVKARIVSLKGTTHKLPALPLPLPLPLPAIACSNNGTNYDDHVVTTQNTQNHPYNLMPLEAISLTDYPLDQTDSMANPVMMMAPMNNQYYSQLLGGGGVYSSSSSSNNNNFFMSNSLDRPIGCYDPAMSGVFLDNNMGVNNPLSQPFGYYWTSPNVQTMSPYMQFLQQKMTGGASSSTSVHASQMDKYYKSREF